MTTAPMSEAELLAKLREIDPKYYNGDPDFALSERYALALLTSWRDETVRAAYERGHRHANQEWRNRLNRTKFPFPKKKRARTKEPEQHG